MRNKFLRRLAAIGAIVGASVVMIMSPDLIESLVKHLSDASQNKFTQDCFIFSLAAAIHSGRMKKEIRASFESLSLSIDKVAEAFRADLEVHGKKLDNLAERVTSLEGSKTTQPQKETQQ